MIRRAAVAGTFYPGAEAALRDAIAQFVSEDAQPEACLGCVAPHAGYVYSGRVAAEVYSRIRIPSTAVILSPNHRGPLVNFSLWPDGRWETPLGSAVVDADLGRAILDACPMLSTDTAPHKFEHAAEVQVPFVQYFAPETRIVPIMISCRRLDQLKEFGQGLAEAVKACSGDALVIASSDMTHQEPHEIAKKKDRLAIERILALDEDGLFETVIGGGITMCGIFPTVAMLACTKALGASSAELALYQTSGDASGDYTSVVGYAGLLVK